MSILNNTDSDLHPDLTCNLCPYTSEGYLNQLCEMCVKGRMVLKDGGPRHVRPDADAMDISDEEELMEEGAAPPVEAGKPNVGSSVRAQSEEVNGDKPTGRASRAKGALARANSEVGENGKGNLKVAYESVRSASRQRSARGRSATPGMDLDDFDDLDDMNPVNLSTNDVEKLFTNSMSSTKRKPSSTRALTARPPFSGTAKVQPTGRTAPAPAIQQLLLRRNEEDEEDVSLDLKNAPELDTPTEAKRLRLPTPIVSVGQADLVN
ncbi:hypothetical protein HK101_006285, partial [Irineochytrium annulatum]